MAPLWTRDSRSGRRRVTMVCRAPRVLGGDFEALVVRRHAASRGAQPSLLRLVWNSLLLCLWDEIGFMGDWTNDRVGRVGWRRWLACLPGEVFRLCRLS